MEQEQWAVQTAFFLHYSLYVRPFNPAALDILQTTVLVSSVCKYNNVAHRHLIFSLKYGKVLFWPPDVQLQLVTMWGQHSHTLYYYCCFF